MVDKIIRSLYYSLFFVTPLLMFPLTSELFEFNKMIFIYLTAVVLGFAWILKINQDKKLVLKRTNFDIPILLFVASQVLSTIFSIDRQTSVFGYYGRFNGGLLSVFAFTFLFYGLVNFAHLIDLKKLLKLSLLSSFITVLWGLPGRFGHDLSCWIFTQDFGNSCWTDQFRPSERMFSTLGQPNWFGAYLAINFFVGLYFFLKSAIDKDRKGYLIYIVYLVFNFGGILFSRSRSALVALVVGLITFGGILIYRNLKDKSLMKVLKIRIAPIFLIFVAVVLYFKTGVAGVDKYINFTNEKPSVKVEKQTPVSSEVSESFDIRKIVWKGAVDLGFKYPLFGTGVETFAYSYYFVRPLEHNLTSEWDYLYNKAHNEYLNYFATTGFFGLASYLLLIAFTVTLFLKKLSANKKDFLTLGLFASYLSILITNFFGFSTSTIDLFFYSIPAFLLIDSKEKKVIQKDLGKNRQLIFLGGLVLFLYWLLSIVKYYQADMIYASSQNYSRVGDYQTASTLLSQALKLKKEHVYEDKLSYSLANLAFVASYEKESDLAKNFARLSQSYNAKSLKTAPKNVLYWKTKAKNHYLFYQMDLQQGQLQEGLKALAEAGKLSPTDPKIPYTNAIFYSLLGDTEENADKKAEYQSKALSEIGRSIDLKPDFRDGLLLKGQLLKKYGRTDEANKVFEYILKNIDLNDQEAKDELGK